MINADELIAQREEATGVDGNRIAFEFTALRGEQKGERLVFTFRDPARLTDEEQEDLLEVPRFGPDQAMWYMGDDEYDRFREAGGESWIFAEIMKEYTKEVQGVDPQGRPTRPNRSSRRRRKQ
ncbi:hypothetical protein [Corynebacterium sp.]|uniref:hypothetical protein n=1 Tax=Corynebacterium sp. TaxID=1720 RepID=UPI0025C33C85|nr:hypothetical protein [Corynebacterium sp.]